MSFLLKKKKKVHLTIPQKKLFFHVKNQNLNRIKHYIEVEKIDPNLRDVDDWSFLHHAANTGNTKNATYLLQHGTSIDSKCSKGSFSGWTALHVASFKGDVDMVELLIGVGANIKTRNMLLKKARDIGKRRVKRVFKKRKTILAKYRDLRLEIKKFQAESHEDAGESDDDDDDDDDDEDSGDEDEEDDEVKMSNTELEKKLKDKEPKKQVEELKKVVLALRVRNKMLQKKKGGAEPRGEEKKEEEEDEDPNKQTVIWEEGNNTHKCLKDFIKVEGILQRLIKKLKENDLDKSKKMLDKLEKRNELLLKTIEKDMNKKLQKVRDFLKDK